MSSCVTSAVTSVSSGEAAQLRLRFFGYDGRARAPNTVTISIQCLTTGQTVRSEETVSGATVVDVLLLSSENTLISTAASETRQVNILAAFGADENLPSTVTYTVVP